MAASAAPNEYEMERLRRIEANRRMLEALDLPQVAQDLQRSAAEASPAVAAARLRAAGTPRRPRRSSSVVLPEQARRRSSRVQDGRVCFRDSDFFCELEGEGAPTPRGPRIHGTYLTQLSEEEVEAIRVRHGVQALQEFQAGHAGQGGADSEVLTSVLQALSARAAAAGRGSVDSGKGVRVQGGRVYDSKHGITCHWCRQKTLEEHVTCSRPECGAARLPTTFCHKCLLNRNGEDCAEAAASGRWVCPMCRGTCGAGCVSCCNCGPCRKKLGLEPTHQVVGVARSSGFGNVHDYLVHLVTGEGAEAIAARKAQHHWGRWTQQQQQQHQVAGSQPSDAAAANAGGRTASAPPNQGAPSDTPSAYAVSAAPAAVAAAAAATAAVGGVQEGAEERAEGVQGRESEATNGVLQQAGAAAAAVASEVKGGAQEAAAPLQSSSRKRGRLQTEQRQQHQPLRAGKPKPSAAGGVAKRMLRAFTASASAVRA